MFHLKRILFIKWFTISVQPKDQMNYSRPTAKGNQKAAKFPSKELLYGTPSNRHFLYYLQNMIYFIETLIEKTCFLDFELLRPNDIGRLKAVADVTTILIDCCHLLP